MKKGIHPEYVDCVITCGCGAKMETRSVKSEMHVEICSKCHPFYSGGTDKLVDTAGRIEKFRQRFQLKEGESSVKAKKAKK
jgi:large subunit ribosomal protein L31